MKWITAIFFLSLVSLFSCSTKQDNRVIDPLSNVAGIKPDSTLNDVIHIFGEQNVASVDVPVGEGMTVRGSRIIGGTKNEILIEWKQQSGTPERITIDKPGSNWQTRQGITIGSSIQDVERLNGGPFNITGFEWDYPGLTISWEGGNLPDELQLEFEYRIDLAQELMSEVPMGAEVYSTSQPIFKKLGLTVSKMYVRWQEK